MDSYFIDIDDLKDIALINRNVNDEILKVIVQRVQKAVIRPVTGTALYKRLSQGIDDTINAGPNPLNNNEKLLLNDYIHPLLAAACDRKAINALTYEIRSKTVGKAQDEHIQAVLESENLRLDNDIRQDVRVARDELIAFLKDNCDDYPEYKTFTLNNENIKPDKNDGGASTVAFI